MVSEFSPLTDLGYTFYPQSPNIRNQAMSPNMKIHIGGNNTVMVSPQPQVQPLAPLAQAISGPPAQAGQSTHSAPRPPIPSVPSIAIPNPVTQGSAPLPHPPTAHNDISQQMSVIQPKPNSPARGTHCIFLYSQPYKILYTATRSG